MSTFGTNYDSRVASTYVSPVGGLLKRTADIVLSAALLVFFGPLMLLVALAIKWSDEGPAFFGHKRVGLGGREFHCLKFRSMVTNSSEVLARLLAENPAARKEWDETQKLRDDPRVTRLGKFLRVTSLDELPQLINVLRGDMSLVGPRPIVDAERARYGTDLPFYERTRPGITGLWQVSGRSDVSYQRRVELDVKYVEDWSIWADVMILWRTIGVVFDRRGSY
jgi:exopolysaccharide production protein ExoY